VIARSRSRQGDEHEFTEGAYRALVQQARARYRFLSFADASTADAGVLWRHDIDISVHRALALARIEHDEQVRATYFVYLHSRFYNALEDAIVDRLRQIAALGHEIGVHFDSRFIPAGMSAADAIAAERDVIAAAIGTDVRALSFHDPDVPGVSAGEADDIAGLVNAYGAGIKARFAYGSDSNGYWRFKPLAEVIGAAGDRLQVLTHPEWWVPEPMAPRARVARAIDGRAAYMAAKYDAAIADAGRENIR
jgi:hypothetical protein